MSLSDNSPLNPHIIRQFISNSKKNYRVLGKCVKWNYIPYRVRVDKNNYGKWVTEYQRDVEHMFLIVKEILYIRHKIKLQDDDFEKFLNMIYKSSSKYIACYDERLATVSHF